MSKPRIVVAFYSTYGTNHKVALEAARAAEAAGAEVRLRRIPETAPKSVIESQDAWKDQAARMADIPEATPADMEWADGYFFSGPTRFGVVASQVRAFIDTLGGVWSKGGLSNKTFTATTSAQNAHGGQEGTILSLYTTAMHWGAVIVAPGYTSPVLFKAGGNPYGYSSTNGAFGDDDKAAVAHQAARLVEMTAKLVTREPAREPEVA